MRAGNRKGEYASSKTAYPRVYTQRKGAKDAKVAKKTRINEFKVNAGLSEFGSCSGRG